MVDMRVYSIKHMIGMHNKLYSLHWSAKNLKYPYEIIDTDVYILSIRTNFHRFFDTK